MDTGIENRVAVVTGGSGAIGGAIARGLADEGATVIITYHSDEAGANAVVAKIAERGGRAAAMPLDQSDPAAVAASASGIRAEWGDVGILVANAVEWPDRTADELASLARSLDVNLLGTVRVVDAVLPGMRAAGWGRIVLVSTDIVEQPMAGSLSYPVAKGALETASRVLAVREAAAGILTNVVRPGFTLTDRALESPFMGQRVVDAEAARTPTGRICTPEDVASAVLYLASAANGHVNGQVLSVAGGRELVR